MGTAFDKDDMVSTLELVGQAVGIYDFDDRLEIFNQQYRELRSAIGGDVQLGVPWPRLVRDSVRSGAIAEARGRESEWLDYRIRRRGAYSVVRDLPDGRCYSVNERRLPSGRVVVVWQEIAKPAALPGAFARIGDGAGVPLVAPNLLSAADHIAALVAMIGTGAAPSAGWSAERQQLYDFWITQGLSTRAARIVAIADCRSIADIRRRGRTHFQRAEGCGRATLQEIERNCGGFATVVAFSGGRPAGR